MRQLSLDVSQSFITGGSQSRCDGLVTAATADPTSCFPSALGTASDCYTTAFPAPLPNYDFFDYRASTPRHPLLLLEHCCARAEVRCLDVRTPTEGSSASRSILVFTLQSWYSLLTLQFFRLLQKEKFSFYYFSFLFINSFY